MNQSGPPKTTPETPTALDTLRDISHGTAREGLHPARTGSGPHSEMGSTTVKMNRGMGGRMDAIGISASEYFVIGRLSRVVLASADKREMCVVGLKDNGT